MTRGGTMPLVLAFVAGAGAFYAVSAGLAAFSGAGGGKHKSKGKHPTDATVKPPSDHGEEDRS